MSCLYQFSPKSPTADDLRTVIWKSINSFIGLVVVGLVTAGLCYKKWTGESPSPGSRDPLTGQRVTELAINAINRFHLFPLQLLQRIPNTICSPGPDYLPYTAGKQEEAIGGIQDENRALPSPRVFKDFIIFRTHAESLSCRG